MDDITLNPPAPTSGDPAPVQPTTEQKPSSTRLFDSLPEGLRGSDTFTKFIDPATNDLSLGKLAESYQHLQSAAGWPADQIIRMPKADDAEGMGQLYNRLGRPETPDAYSLEGLDTMSEGDQAFINGFREKAHAAGITQAGMSAMMAHLSEALGTVDQQIEQQTVAAREAATAELKKAWGDKYDVMRSEIPETLKWLGEKAGLIKADDAEGLAGLVKALNVGGEADNPQLMQLFGALADLRAEGGALPGTGKAVVAGDMTVAQAQEAKQAFLANSEMQDALHDATHAKHALAIAERDRLNKILTQPS